MSDTDDETLTTKDRTSKKIGYEMRLAFYDHGDVDMRAASPDALSLLIRVTDSIAKISTGGDLVSIAREIEESAGRVRQRQDGERHA